MPVSKKKVSKKKVSKKKVARKKVGRRATPAAPAIITVDDKKALAEGTQVFNEDAQRLALVEKQLDNSLPFDLNTSINFIQRSLAASATEYIRAGLELVRIKEYLPHGELTEVLETKLNIKPRTARVMMSVALRFHNRLKLATKLNPSALLELIHEDDESLDALEAGGTIAELQLDKVAMMTTAELRDHLRKAEKKIKDQDEDYDKMVSEKERKINNLDKQLSGKDADLDRLEIDIRKDLTSESLFALGAIDRIGDLLAKAKEHFDNIPEETKAEFTETIKKVGERIDEVDAEFLSALMPEMTREKAQELEVPTPGDQTPLDYE